MVVATRRARSVDSEPEHVASMTASGGGMVATSASAWLTKLACRYLELVFSVDICCDTASATCAQTNVMSNGVL